MLENIEKFLHLVNDYIGVQRNGDSQSVLVFDHFTELGEQVLRPMDEDDDGSWKDHLICLPPVGRVDVVFEYMAFMNFVEDGRGMTMEQFVWAFRQQFSHAEGDFRKNSDSLGLRCDDCGDDFYY
jgi:hypothetical protein